MFPNMWEKIGQEVQTSKPSTSFLDYALLFLLIGHGGRMSSAVRFELWKFGVLQESNGDCNSNTPSLVACPSTLLYLTLDTKSLCFFVNWVCGLRRDGECCGMDTPSSWSNCMSMQCPISSCRWLMRKLEHPLHLHIRHVIYSHEVDFMIISLAP